MADYRIYFVDARGRVSMGETLGSVDEEQALALLADAHQPDAEFVELWFGGRLVRRVPNGRGQP